MLRVHEIWEDPGPRPDSAGSIGVCFAGPLGDGFRRMIGPGATLVGTIEAGSWQEAMRLYHARQGWEPYKPEPDWVDEPYPDDGYTSSSAV